MIEHGGRRRRWRPRSGAWGCGLVAVAALGMPQPAQAAPAVEPMPGSTGPALAVTQVRRLPLSTALARGDIEDRSLSLHGLTVRGAYRRVRTRTDGTEEILAELVPTVAPQLAPEDARIDAAVVPDLVAAHHGVGQAPTLERPPQLVYLMILGQPVLAWEAQVALTMWPEPTRPTVWVSAASGRVLREVEQVRSSRAHIFAENPAITPEAIEVELLDIDVDEAGHPLVGPRVQAFNCVGQETTEVSPWWEEDQCWPTQTVFSDAQGDFFVPLPDIVKAEDNIAGGDPYSELSMYVHAELFLDVMRDRGIEQFQCELASMLSNFRTLTPSSTLDFSPLNNAYYTNQCDPEKGPTMLFGQGSEVDFGYDGDVVYHELGHGMVAMLAPDGLSGRRLRSDGSLVDASGINEALADYFSVMLTDDPHLADYVGRFWSSSSRPYIRDAENTRTCPNDMAGQSHNDGEPFMAALWATRKRLDDAGKVALDHVVLEGLMRLPRDADVELTSATMLEMADVQVQQGDLSPDDYDLLRRSFEARGLLDCPRVITDAKRVRDGRTLYLRRMDAAVSPFYPGPMQMRYQVPADADDMVARFSLRPRGSSEPVEALVLVKRGDTPISFEYQLVAVDDPPVEPPDPDAEPSDPVRELTLVTGDWDLELTAIEKTETDYELVLGGLEPGEVLHVMLVNVSPTEATASGTSLFSSAELMPADAGEDSTGAGDTVVPPMQDEVRAGVGQAGCACGLRGATGLGGAGAGLWLLPLLARRRRRWRG